MVTTESQETFDQAQSSRHVVWRSQDPSLHETSVLAFTGEEYRCASELHQPIKYFRDLIDDDIFELLRSETQRYAIQRNIDSNFALTKNELEQFLGMTFMMSISKLPRLRMYWSPATRCNKVADIMQLKRFEEIKRNFHCVDNESRPATCNDKLFKIRPVYDKLKNKFNDITPTEMISIDEQVVPFKGRSPLRTYNPKKPKKWGYKIFVCSGSNGLIFDFEIFTGSIDVCPDQPDIGASGNIVLRLLQHIPRDAGYKIYVDNWFTSLNLQSVLWKQGIGCLGTVRANRLRGCTMPTDSEMKKEERGFAAVQTGVHDGVHMNVVKWMDNRGVLLLSTYAGVNPTSEVKRWDKKTRSEVCISCPSIVNLYNQFMGGVDLLDSLIALYRCPIRSKKPYLRLLFHFFDMAIVQSWLMYMRDADGLGTQKKERLPLLAFKCDIADILMNQGKAATVKRGRPSRELEVQLESKRRRGSSAHVPSLNIRTDNVGHWPVFKEHKGRCKIPNCTGIPKVSCSKCGVYLCFVPNRNCFYRFHNS